jgi:hypothetical protein
MTMDPLAEVRRLMGSLQEIVERERRLQRELADRLLAPVDGVFDLLEQSAAMLHQQADALEAAGRALGDTARLMQRQAELFERSVVALREPLKLIKASAGPSAPPLDGGS